MAEIHVTLTTDKSGNSFTVHNPGQHPLAPGAGQPVVAAAKAVGNPNGVAHGQINASGSIPGPTFHNPA
jgi:hypothetical protein